MPDRPSFRRRLLVRLGVALTLALAVTGVAVWLSLAAWSTHEARRVLRLEAATLQGDILRPDGALDPSLYYWDEPHHRFDASRIDPIFLQVFDADGRLLRASDNVAQFHGAYPNQPLSRTDGDGPTDPLPQFEIGDQRIYRITEVLRNARGEAAGVVQVGRFVPPLQRRLSTVGLMIAGGLGTLLAALLALAWIVAGRVVRPLQAITAHAAGLSAATLGERVPVPADADGETAALAAALNGSLTRLDDAFSEMQRFTANAAHELQTPLTVLRGHVDVALRRDREPEAYRETLRILRAEVDGMVLTVRGLLSLARLDGDTPLPTEPVDLADIARLEADAIRPRAEARGLTLTLDAHPTCAQAHPDLVRDVVRNLLDNAVKYTEVGGVELAVADRDGVACLTVTDTGRGIAAEDAARVTDRFWRAADVQHLPGSGLGLALVARVVARFGGAFTVEANDPVGTRVVVTFPASPLTASLAAAG